MMLGLRVSSTTSAWVKQPPHSLLSVQHHHVPVVIRKMVNRSFSSTTPNKVYTSPWPDLNIPEVSVSSLLLNTIERYGNKAAVTEALTGESYSYNDIRQLSHNFAANLHHRGFKKGDVFALFAHNSKEWPVAFHGISSLGAIVSPAGPQHSAEELAEQLVDSGSRSIVSSADLLPTALRAAQIANIDQDKIYVIGEHDHNPAHNKSSSFIELLKEAKTRAPTPDIKPKSDIAVLPYSSGTTGKPKGVMLTHYNVVSNLLQVNSIEPLGEKDSLIGILPFWHIYGLVLTLNCALYGGAHIAVLPRFTIDSFLRTLQDYKINRAHIAPPLIVMLAKHPAVAHYDLSHLKIIFSGAAPLGSETEIQCMKRIPGCTVKQAYGMTEMSPASHITPDSKIKSGSVGPTVPNTKIKIISTETGEPLGLNEVGELCVHGPQVMLGYLNRPEETIKTFDSEGFLKTGDTAKIDEDGYVYIVDRVKELIKYKGHQVPPAELEALILSHPAVADVAVVGLKDEVSGEIPKAFVVLKKGHEDVKSTDILDFVAIKVAPYKRIRFVEFIDQIPKSASGKILRRLLRDRKPNKGN
eukprot:TRINITY_DN7247_c0_g1_i1.p1 TRINITY_DN7247_c0_g1~~TRINITY_DN7247_c0_g1_i1.p1  ORF type:complete len:581 (-),score=97.94 TRINITY_DN7247_c0_g1_i1:107-1849(-)